MTTARVVIALATSALLAAGCTTQSGDATAASTTTSSPSTSAASPSPTETTLSPAQQDLRDAGHAVTRYWAVSDELASDPSKSLNLLSSVAQGQALAQRRVILTTYTSNGWVQKGAVVVSDVKASTSNGHAFAVSACVDVSGVDLVDKNGVSQVPASRPDQQRFTYTVSKTTKGFFVTTDTLKGKPC